MKIRERHGRGRLAFCLVGFLAGFLLLAFRSFQLHAGIDKRVERMESRQRASQITLAPLRGTIFDAKGRELAVGLRVPSVFADPSEITRLSNAIAKVSPVLKMSRNDITRKMKSGSKKFVWLKRRVDPSTASRVRALKLPGLHVMTEGGRLYPDRELAAQILGVVGADGQGLEGIERFYDAFLRSQKLVVHTEKDAKGRSIFSRDIIFLEPEAGAHLYLTIDLTIQHLTEDELERAAVESGSKHAMAVVMEPRTGKILALASYPRVNPNRLDRTEPQGWRNRPVEEVYEPGSTFKIFTLAAALETESISPDEPILCRKGSLVVSGKVIRTHTDHEWLRPKDVLKFSDNIGAARVALKTGRRNLDRVIREFGFGQRTGIDFPGETRGLLAPAKGWRDVDLANIAFGQGIGVTAIQLAAAVSVIANGGSEVRPYLVERAVFSDGRSVDFRRSFTPKRVVSSRTVALLTDWMESVTAKDGTGIEAAMSKYRVAGKTGTAQKIDPATRKYAHDLVVSSFTGFAPVSNPELAGLFIFDQPRQADYGGTLAGPVFRKVMETALNYLNVPPDLEPPDESHDFLVSVADVTTVPSRAEFSPDTIPDVLGLTVREVLTEARKRSVRVRIVGSGVAVQQEPLPGASVANSKTWEVRFAPDRSRT
ncbi:MAG TPA: penicillin-binding protein [Bdellovibrionota bacterium]|nr:penicillin-binding protein [Bdellovibrionota bacterium]